MRVTPLDIINKQFRSSRQGLDRTDVLSFLEDVRVTLEEILNENQRLRSLVARRDEEIADLRGEESSIKDTLLLARRLTEDLERRARRESDLIIGEARLEAQKILMSTADERRELQKEIVELQSQKVRMIAEIGAILSAHSKMLKEYS
ncbi:MAG: DivIVA domain-containing protein [Myxococcota bacterium]|nr:DivIVA domain-containing protein [Myxococcota bacterium]